MASSDTSLVQKPKVYFALPQLIYTLLPHKNSDNAITTH